MENNINLDFHPKVARRITFGLVHRADEDLSYLVAHTGYNTTDTINRALQLYAAIERNSTETTQLALVEGDPLGTHTIALIHHS